MEVVFSVFRKRKQIYDSVILKRFSRELENSWWSGDDLLILNQNS